MLHFLRQLWYSKDLRSKILFTTGILLFYRLLTQISIPGANLDAIKSIFDRNAFLGVFSTLTGGSAENFSIVMMGVSPYINASIIIQLLTVIIPKMESLSKEGEHGKRVLNKYTRWLTLPLAFLQSYGMLVLLNSQAQGVPIIENIRDPKLVIPVMLTITAGTLLLMWLGELISEKGIGNGVSMIIFASIVSSIPQTVGQQLFLAQSDSTQILPLVVTVIFTLLLMVFIVMITEGQRKIPITYANQRMRAQGEQSIIPIRINQAGMIPIIFAVSLVTFPNLLSQFLINAETPWLKSIASFLAVNFQINSPAYLIGYFLLIIVFTYFYVSITFNPSNVAENIQKRGGYVPGIRPGKETAEHLGAISNRMNLWGGLFLAVIAILPILLPLAFGKNISSGQELISGAGLIIIVGVVLELVRQVNSQMLMHDYDKIS